MTGYDFHPEAALDLDEIWEFIAEASLDCPTRPVYQLVLVPPSPLVSWNHRVRRKFSTRSLILNDLE